MPESPGKQEWQTCLRVPRRTSRSGRNGKGYTVWRAWLFFLTALASAMVLADPLAAQALDPRALGDRLERL